MAAGGTVLSVVFGYGRWVAVLSALCLLSANLDNVPDCPELLNQNSRAAISAQLSHHLNLAKLPIVPYGTVPFARASITQAPVVPGIVTPQFPPTKNRRLREQASDPSPPLI